MAALPGTEIAYAGKAFLCRAMAQWVGAEGLSLDVCSAGELAVAGLGCWVLWLRKCILSLGVQADNVQP